MSENRHATLMLTNFQGSIHYYILSIRQKFSCLPAIAPYSRFDVPVDLLTSLPEKRGKPDNYISSYYSLFP